MRKKPPPDYSGCPLCSRPVLEDHVYCSQCELDEAEVAARNQKQATIYEFPSGRIIVEGKNWLA